MYDIKSNVFGKKLKELRLESGKSLSEIAKAIYKSKPTLYKYEEGLLQPSLETMMELANLFDVNIDAFFGENERRTYRDVNPFNTDKLYLYYKGRKSIMISIITIENEGYQKSTFYNCVKSDSINAKMYGKYERKLIYEKGMAYFTYESELKDTIECVMVQVEVPTGDEEKYYGWIASDKFAEKVVILREYIDDQQELRKLVKDLEITEEEKESMNKHDFWEIDISMEKDLRNEI